MKDSNAPVGYGEGLCDVAAFLNMDASEELYVSAAMVSGVKTFEDV